MKTIVRRILCILHQVRASPSQATVSLSGLPHVNHSKNPLYPRLGYSTDTSDGNTKVIVSYLSMNLATHSILFFSHLIFNTNLNVLQEYEGFIWCYIYNWLVIIIFFFTIAIYMYIIQNSMSIYFCTIYYDQKTFEFNSFKMTIFTNIWSIFSWQNMQILNWKRMKHICYGLHRRQAFRLQKQNLLCCDLLEVSKLVPNFSI